MNRLADFASQFSSIFVEQIASKVKAVLLVIGLGGTGIGGWMLGQQAMAGLSYEPAVATITAAGYRCESRDGTMRGCSEAEVQRLKSSGSKQKVEYRVTFAFADRDGMQRNVSGFITLTGLPREEAVRGATFNMLYDPANPSRTSLPFGADYHALLIALVGIAALSFYIAIFGLPFGHRRETSDYGIYAG